MHEMGIVLHLAKTLEETAKEQRLTRIGKVTLQVGEVSGIMTDLFSDCWSYFSPRHPLLADSELVLEPVPAVTYCDGCGKTYATVQYGRTCPHCGSEETWLVSGNECVIKEIEAEFADEAEETDAGADINTNTNSNTNTNPTTD